MPDGKNLVLYDKHAFLSDKRFNVQLHIFVLLLILQAPFNTYTDCEINYYSHGQKETVTI